ncbi:protein tyrosine phosphatase family protein [Arcobacter peruensis]|uniref:protein tyrosine phosphatase family protein n=1 Tax=Arcobacter peruensis TaxID=2320140 RepID=UPI000F07C92C|nr:protein tyrosine phosphatase family protein [Arcobacter peruensis]
MENILNYIEINELISTSGQPSVEQFKQIADNDFEVVINLALHNASNAIENEDKIVTDLNMAYFHIPVDFENPKASDVKLFLNTLQALGSNKVWVHCALNYRVSAFMYIYHKYVLKTPFDDIDISLFEQWSPDVIWQEIIKISYNEIKNA